MMVGPFFCACVVKIDEVLPATAPADGDGRGAAGAAAAAGVALAATGAAAAAGVALSAAGAAAAVALAVGVAVAPGAVVILAEMDGLVCACAPVKRTSSYMYQMIVLVIICKIEILVRTLCEHERLQIF